MFLHPGNEMKHNVELKMVMSDGKPIFQCQAFQARTYASATSDVHDICNYWQVAVTPNLKTEDQWLAPIFAVLLFQDNGWYCNSEGIVAIAMLSEALGSNMH